MRLAGVLVARDLGKVVLALHTLHAPFWRHPLHDIHLSRRRRQSLLCQPVAPMAQAVKLRAKLIELGYSVLLLVVFQIWTLVLPPFMTSSV
jgi:hypothetical protein